MREGKRGVMTEDNSRPPSICSPEADCNSNNTVLDNVTASQLSNTSSHEGDLNPDTNEYQWFLDFGLKDGGNRYQTSIFSLSPLHQDLTYDDLAKNIDANLAEIDMENFRSEDIHSILALPAMFCGDFESHKHGEQFASMSGSLMAKFDALDSSLTPKSSSQGSTKDDSDVSMCKSEPLFSPVKEAPLLPSFSVDSLDCESYDEQELMLTCQANKNNYTIAFEGSFTHYSDDSDYHDAGGSEATDSNTWSGQYKLCSNNSVDNSMVQSDFVFTTWSKLKRINDVARQKGTSHTEKNQGRYSENYTTAKSQSLPNLFRKSFSGSEMKLSQLNISIDSDQCVPVYDIQTSQSSHSRASDTSSQQSFSLVRLFIQQKGTNSQDTSVAPSLCQSTSSACMDSTHLPIHFDPLAPTNRPNPNLCMDHSDKMKIVNAKRQTSSSSSLEDLDFVKEDIVSRQKNLMSENEKGTNVSGPLSPVHLLGSSARHMHETKDDSEGSHCHSKERTRSRCRLFHMGNANLEDSLTEGRPRSPATSPIEEETEDNEDVEMVSIEEIKVENPKDIERNKENKEKETLDTSEICNNALDPAQPSTFWDPRPSGVDVINNFFPSCKSNTCQTNLALIGAEDKLGWKDDLSPVSLSQGTQTKRFNSKESSPVEPPGVRSPQSDLHQEVLNNARRNQVHERGENNSSSSCHSNNRNSRLRRNSPGFINNTQNEGMQTLRRRLNVTITTMRSFGTQIPVHVTDQAVQTSLVDDLSNKPSFTIHEEVADKSTKVPSPEPSQIIENQNCNKTDDKINNTSKEKLDKKSVYVYYPNYSLPDLSFLKSSLSSSLNSARMFLVPQTLKSSGTNSPPNRRASRPHSCPDVDSLRRQNFGHIKDWDSLSVLLPREVRNILIGSSDAPDPSKDIPNFCRSRPETRTSRCNREPSSAGTNDVPSSALNHMFVYRYDGSDAEGPEFIHPPPPLPKRSISLPRSGSSENEAPKSPLPKGILRKPSPSRTGRDCGIYSKRYSMSDFSAYKFPDDLTLKRLSLQEPWEFLVNPNEETCIQKDNPASMEPQPCNSSIILSPKNIKKPSETVQAWAAKPDNCVPSSQNIDKIGAEKGQEKVTCSSKKFMKTNNCNNKVETNYFIQHSNQNSEPNKDAKAIVTDIKTSPDLVPTAPSASPEFQCSLNSSCEHQVSCTCSCDRNRSKKSVSFSENVAVQESPTPEGMSPSNSPEGSLQAAHHPLAREVSEAQRVYSTCHTGCSIHSPVCHSPINEDIEAESPPQEFSVSPPHGSSPANSLHLSEPVSLETSSATDNTRHVDLNQKKALVLAVNNAVDVIVSLFSSVKDPQEKYKLGSSSLNPVIGHKVLQWLCPAMFSVLSDGLQPALYSFFGRIQNSVWRVIEASSQLGPSTRALNDLVIRLNSEESLKEGVTKFNAFIFGLLNIRSLDSWLAFLRTRENLLQKYYHVDSFLFLSNSATRNLFDDLLVALQPLSVLPFELDLLFEASMKNSMDQLTPYLQSIPSVTRCLNEEDDNQQFNCLLYHQDTIQQQGTVGKETKDYHNQQARQACRTQGDILKQIYDEQLPSATSDINEVPIMRNGKDFVIKGKPLLQRHRSCVENSANGFSLADIASNVKKRWSGIQFGSRLIQAFDKMLLDQQWNSNSFCEHLDSPAFWEAQSSNESTPMSPDYCLQKLPHLDENSDISTSRPKPEGSADIPESHSEPYHLEAEILCNPQKMGSEFVANQKSHLSATAKPSLAEQLPPTTLKAKENSEQNKQTKDEGIQFKQLQMKWEQMSAKPEKKNNNNVNINNNCNNTGGSGGRSRIPRLVPSSSRQHKMDDSAISLRSSASGQSSNGQDGSRERLGIQEGRDVKQEDSNKMEPEHKPVTAKLIDTKNKSDIAKPFVQKSSDTPSPRRKVPLPRQGGKLKTVSNMQETGSVANKRLYSPKKQKLVQPGKAISKLPDLSEMQKQNIEGTYDSHFLSTRKVKTLCHHLATDSDQLTYSKGETLTVWTEVDSDWLLCSRGQERGLVSKLCVIKTNDN